MRYAVVFALLSTIAGCAAPAQTFAPPSDLPRGWDHGVPLESFYASARHSGAFTVDLENATLERPAACRAYRTDRAAVEDRCVVRDPEGYETSTRSSLNRNGTWVIEAGWAGCPGGDFSGCPSAPRPEHGTRRVVAFDADGHPVGFWNGTLSPGTLFATE